MENEEYNEQDMEMIRSLTVENTNLKTEISDLKIRIGELEYFEACSKEVSRVKLQCSVDMAIYRRQHGSIVNQDGKLFRREDDGESKMSDVQAKD